MRLFRVYAVAALLGLFVQTAKAGMLDDCNHGSTPDETISACTRSLAQLRLDSENRSIIYNRRGNAYRSTKQFDRAIADYERAIRLDPDQVHPYNGLGNTYVDLHDPDRAIEYYDKALRKDSSYELAYNGRGNAYTDKKEFDRALADFDQAIRLDPRDALAFNGRGLVYSEKGDPDRAIQDTSEAIRLKPNYSGAYNNRGNAYSDKNDYDRAFADYMEAIRLDPNEVHPYNGRGNVYFRRGDNDRAIADYNKALQLNPNYVSAYRNRGRVYHGLGQYDQAILDYDQAIKIEPSYAPTYNSRGNTYLLKKQYAQAVHDYDQAIRLNHDPADEEGFKKNRTDALTKLQAVPEAKPENKIDSPTQNQPEGKIENKAAAIEHADPCASAATHWTSVESIGTRAAYEDHLARFPNCAFTTLALARIDALRQKSITAAPVSNPPSKSSLTKTCGEGFVLDNDGDCVREKHSKKVVSRKTTPRTAAEPSGGGTLNCSNPAEIMACANRALSTLPGSR